MISTHDPAEGNWEHSNTYYGVTYSPNKSYACLTCSHILVGTSEKNNLIASWVRWMKRFSDSILEQGVIHLRKHRCPSHSGAMPQAKQSYSNMKNVNTGTLKSEMVQMWCHKKRNANVVKLKICQQKKYIYISSMISRVIRKQWND